MSKMQCKIGIWTLVSRPGSETEEENNEARRKTIEQERVERKIIKEENRRNSFVNKPKGWRRK